MFEFIGMAIILLAIGGIIFTGSWWLVFVILVAGVIFVD